jgi:hypothetical protein
MTRSDRQVSLASMRAAIAVGESYLDLLTLWKDADLDIPIFIPAKSE